MIFTICSRVAALMLIGTVCLQARLIGSLRAKQRQRLAELEQMAEAPTESISRSSESFTPMPSELLRLRNEVSRLSARKGQLARTESENERLRAQLTERSTNSPGRAKLPPGYIRKSQARFVGYNRPADTIQSFLWALQNHDLAALRQAFAPTQPDISESLFSRTRDLFGMRLLGNEPEPTEDPMQLQVELVPGVSPSLIGLQQIGGEWKILWVPF